MCKVGQKLFVCLQGHCNFKLCYILLASMFFSLSLCCSVFSLLQVLLCCVTIWPSPQDSLLCFDTWLTELTGKTCTIFSSGSVSEQLEIENVVPLTYVHSEMPLNQCALSGYPSVYHAWNSRIEGNRKFSFGKQIWFHITRVTCSSVLRSRVSSQSYQVSESYDTKCIIIDGRIDAEFLQCFDAVGLVSSMWKILLKLSLLGDPAGHSQVKTESCCKVAVKCCWGCDFAKGQGEISTHYPCSWAPVHSACEHGPLMRPVNSEHRY